MRKFALSAIAFSAFASQALAADLPSRKEAPELPPPPVETGWKFSVNLYGWATGLDGRLRTLPPLPAVNVNIDFADVLKNLNGALMASGNAQYGRYLLFTDLIYSKISPNAQFHPSGYPASVSLESATLIGLFAGGYRFIDGAQFKLDGFVGARVFAMFNSIDVNVAPFGVKYGKDEAWVDAVVGGRAHYDFNEKWSATAIGFVGAGGAKYEWDVFGGVGYNFNERYTTFAGYRALQVDYQNGNFLYKAIMNGPVIGLHVNF